VYEKSLEMRHFRVFHYPKEAEPAACWPARVGRDGKHEKTAPTEAVGCIIQGGQEVKTELLVYRDKPTLDRPVPLFSGLGLRDGLSQSTLLVR